MKAELEMIIEALQRAEHSKMSFAKSGVSEVFKSD